MLLYLHNEIQYIDKYPKTWDAVQSHTQTIGISY